MSERLPLSKSFVTRLRERVTSLYAAVTGAPSLAPSAGDSDATLWDKFLGLVSELSLRGSSSAVSVPTIAALRALDVSNLANGTVITVAGYHTAGDGGGASFRYSPTSAAAVNGGTVFATGSGSGRFEWVGGGLLNPRMFGARGNYTADDTPAMQALLAECFARRVGFNVPTKGNYRVTDTLVIPDGWAGSIDFGGGSLSGGGADFYLDATGKPFLRLLDPSHFSIGNLTLYIKPENGWGLTDTDSRPQTGPDAYCFDAVGWITFMEIYNISCFYGSGFLKSRADTALVPSRSAGAAFNNFIRTIHCRYGHIAIDLETGSGSSWENVYLASSSGTTYDQSAVSALRVRTSVQNELFSRLNVEWSAFSGRMLDLTGSDIHFEGFHMEGIRPLYSGSSAKDLIFVLSGKIKFTNGHFRDLYPQWGSLVTLNMFAISGGPLTTVILEACKMEAWNVPSGYYYRRYEDNSGGANMIECSGVDDRAVAWDPAGPSWYGPSEKPQLASKRLEHGQHFAGDPSAFTTYSFGSPTAPAAVIPTVDPGYHPGVLECYTGTTNFSATLLGIPQTKVYPKKGVVKYKLTFLLPALPSSASDDFRFRAGVYSDVSGTPYSTPTDGVGLEMSFTDFGDNSLRLACRRGGAVTYSTLVSSAGMVANRWYEVEILLNHDGTQARAYLNPRTSANAANVTSNIPLQTTPLSPQIQFVGRGSGTLTVRAVQLDDFWFGYAPNGRS